MSVTVEKTEETEETEETAAHRRARSYCHVAPDHRAFHVHCGLHVGGLLYIVGPLLDRDGRCSQCGLHRCPACMEFV